MSFSAQVITDSISHENSRLTTMQLRYPRFIHSEFMTHRVFSRNASSSRAIPVDRMIEDIIRDTAMPIHWGKNQKGMQADEENNEPVSIRGIYEDGDMDNLSQGSAWFWARDRAIEAARAFNAAGYHKQVVNRLLEPFMHINVLVTSTDWNNFFSLRDHPDAQPEIRLLAQCMAEARNNSKPEIIEYGEWHLPYVLLEERQMYDIETLKKVSVARCARVSYKTHEGIVPTINKDLELYDRLLASKPLHASPAEHQATPDRTTYRPHLGFVWEEPALHGNLHGWKQYRKHLRGEYVV